MPTVRISVKWKNSTLEDVDVDISQPVSVMKAQLWTLTGVPPDRQKIMIKGLLKDDADLNSMGLKDGQKVMLVGTAEGGELSVPQEKTVFVEDLTAEERAKIIKERKLDPLPAGLINLGNTCYFNAVLQFLKPVKPLTTAICNLPGGFLDADATLKLCGSFREFYALWDKTDEPVSPVLVVNALRERFPQFARKDNAGFGYMQQDAEECLTTLLGLYSEKMKENMINKLFGFQLESTLKCTESEDEPCEVALEHFRKLSCHMGTQLNPVGHLQEGVKLSLQETVEKFSPLLNRDATYQKTSNLISLPQYLVLHFVRFEWKKAHHLARTEAGRAKVCRKVGFPRTLDLYEFCSDSLKEKLKAGRDIWMKRREKEASARNTMGMPKVAENGDKKEEAERGNGKAESEDGLMTGNYELSSVITHQGRSADGGHYVCWVRRSGDVWLKFDDDKVTEYTWSTMDLTGGRSDYHIAIICLYEKLTVSPTEEEPQTLKVEDEKVSSTDK